MADPVQPPAEDRSEDAGSAASSPSAGESPAPKAAEATHFYNAETDDGDDYLLAMGIAGIGAGLPQAPKQLGKYTIEGPIGHGGMGIVWKAHDPDLSRTVAIKVLALHLAQSRTARQRFQREARAAAAISHPHVLTIHAVEEQNQTPFLVMEYVSGGSLKEYVSERGKLNPVQAIQLSCQIAQGLAAAHAQGVIHRDVKPGNVMLHEGGVRVRLADFGLARVAFDNSELTSHDQAVGTPAYMAPEQLRGDRIDARADLFSLGCVMHFMLVGHSPFQGRTQGETIHKILGETPRPLLEIDPTIPPALAEIVDRLLRKDPDERYQSAFEVAEVLERYLTLLNQAPTDEIANILARPRLGQAPGGDKDSDSPRRRRLLGAGGIVAMLAALVAVLVVVFRPPTNGGKTVPEQKPGNETPETVTRPPKLLTVALRDTADFRTLEEALAAAGDGDTVRVTDDATYDVNLNLQNRKQLVLEATAGAQLVAPSPDEHVIQVHGGHSIQIRGFRITTTGVEQHAIVLMGCEGARLEGLTIRQEGSQAVGAIHIADCNVSRSAPFVIANCRIESLRSGQCVWVQPDPQPIWNLIIENNFFQGRSDSTLVALVGRAGSVEIRNNRFATGNVGLNLNLLAPAEENMADRSALQVVNNTFYGCNAWIGLYHTDPQKTPFVVANNLILDCGDLVEASPAQQSALARHGLLAGNIWERDVPPTGEHDGLQQWARFETSVTVKSRDPADESFLRLPDDSPLQTAGAGGELPIHVGARP